jgi:hypothetical protein
MEADMQTKRDLTTTGLKVRTGLASGYWTCTGVQGQHDWRGYYMNNPKASVCYKPKYAPLYGAPAEPGGGEN